MYNIFKKNTSGKKFNEKYEILCRLQNGKLGYPFSDAYHSTFLGHPEDFSLKDLLFIFWFEKTGDSSHGCRMTVCILE